MSEMPASTVPPSPPPVTPGAYPLTFTVEYPEGGRNRLTAFFRLFTWIPIAIVLSLVTGAYAGWSTRSWHIGAAERLDEWGNAWSAAAGTGGVLFLAVLVMVLFRQKYPRWWFDWNLALSRFSARVGSYLGLLRDEYPSTDEEQAVHLDFKYPDAAKDLNRWLPLVKWFLAIPHYFVLFFIGIGAFVVTVIAWFAILFTGKYPRSMKFFRWRIALFDFVVGFTRWGYRVEAYAFLLITDKYPPFSLSE